LAASFDGAAMMTVKKGVQGQASLVLA